eukprot:12878926-Alexandrium_andersonii.AAC.1
MGVRAPQDSDDWCECSSPSRKFIHFLPFHPTLPGLGPCRVRGDAERVHPGGRTRPAKMCPPCR